MNVQAGPGIASVKVRAVPEAHIGTGIFSSPVIVVMNEVYWNNIASSTRNSSMT